MPDFPFQLAVVKMGTGVVTCPKDGRVDRAQLSLLADQVKAALSTGQRVVLVSSGAVGAGLEAMGLSERPGEVPVLQACAAVGQSRLMQVYEDCFSERGLCAAQLLLTRHALVDERQRSRVLATLGALLSNETIVPVINENDSVAVEELTFGDNDVLAAEVALMLEAETFVLLTEVDGLQDRTDESSPKLIQQVDDIDAVLSLVGVEKGARSVGGMASKLEAVRRAVDAGVPAVIANGRNLSQLGDLLSGEGIGTRFSISPSS